MMARDMLIIIFTCCVWARAAGKAINQSLELTAYSEHGGIHEAAYNDSGMHMDSIHNAEHEECKLTVASFDWSNVQNPMIIVSFLFFSAITKLCFHHAGYLVTKIPESCLLIVLGTLAGILFMFTTDADTFPEDLRTLSPHLFFMVLLPPIVLEASYSLHNRVFLDNIGSILVYAVIGTVVCCFLIGPALFLLSYAGALPGGDQVSFIHCMLFASIIVAVDPVAVLAIFQEVGVNSVLYFIVFGESLLNDAVTVVLYHTIEGMNCLIEEGREITAGLYVLAIVKFFTSSIGGIAIGVVFGTITSILTKYTVETRVVEPLLLFSLAYLSFVTSELFHFSGIVGITICGLVQSQYAFHNISHKSYVTVKYFTRMASSSCDSVIFLYLGLNLVRTDHVFHAGFVVAAVLLTLLVRFIITYSLSAIVNKYRLRQITKREQFIMAYGGLRGAVAFSLVSLLQGKLDQSIQSMFMTTILVIIIFTVFIQGGTIKPLVSLLDITTKNKDQLILFNELNVNVTDHIMAGIEEIVGSHGQFFFYDWFMYVDDKYIKHKLQRNPLRKDEKIMKIYEKIALKQHFANLNGADVAQNFVRRSMSGIGDRPPSADLGSMPSVLYGSESRRIPRPSLLSQLTRYGNIDEPTHEDDIAYITPEMLDDEELTSLQQKKLTRQQTVVTEDLKGAEQLRQLLTKPGSSMDARELRSKVDMDDRTNLMYLLQEKNKRLERFKRSLSIVGYEAALPGTASAMATIPEGRGQIVRKPAMVRQGSLDLQGWSTGSSVEYTIVKTRQPRSRYTLAKKRGGQIYSGISNTAFGPSTSLIQGLERQRRLQNLQSLRSLADDAAAETTQDSARVAFIRSQTGKPSSRSKEENRNANSNFKCYYSADSVFEQELAPEEIELDVQPVQRRHSMPERHPSEPAPHARSSLDQEWQHLSPLVELPEKESCVSLVRQAAVNHMTDDSVTSDSESLDNGPLLSHHSSPSSKE